MSMTWQVEAKKPISFFLRNAGVTVTKSNRCPVPIHGSFVTSTSPGLSVCAGKRSRKCATAVAMVFTCPGVPVTACASMRPFVS